MFIADSIIFLALLALSAMFAASEIALFSLRESQVRLMVKNKERNAKMVARLKGDPHRLLVTILSANTLLNIVIGSLSTLFAIEHTSSTGVGIATGVSTVFVLLFGEIFPKTYAITNNKRIARVLAYPIFLCYLVLYPITSLFVWIERRMQGAARSAPHSKVTEEEIRIMSDIGLEHGEIDQHERQMIENIFAFDDIPVGDIMTPKDRIDSLNGQVPIDEIAYHVSQSGFSRFPVYDGNPTKFVGYVHTNDVMRVLNSDERGQPLLTCTSPITRVDETENIEQVFRLMTKERSHMYLVHAKGKPEKIVGLVTMENVLEEIVGEIEDEGDRRAKRARPSM